MVKVKLTLEQAMKTQIGVEFTLSLTSALYRWGCVVNATPRPLYPRELLGPRCIGGWVGPRAGLEGCGKSCLPRGFDRRTVQPVASRYTDWAIAAHTSAVECNTFSLHPNIFSVNSMRFRCTLNIFLCTSCIAICRPFRLMSGSSAITAIPFYREWGPCTVNRHISELGLRSMLGILSFGQTIRCTPNTHVCF